MTLAIPNRASTHTRLHNQSGKLSDTNLSAHTNAAKKQHNNTTLHGNPSGILANLSGRLIEKSQTFQLANEQASIDFHTNLETMFRQHKAQVMLEHVSELPATKLAPNISVRNAIFLDETKVALVQTGETNVLIVQRADDKNHVYLVHTDGTLGKQIFHGDTVLPTGTDFKTMNLTDHDQAQQLMVTGINNGTTNETQQLIIDLFNNKVSIRTDNEHDNTCKDSESIDALETESLSTVFWHDLTVLNLNTPAGTPVSPDEAYAFYSNTSEGRLILDREKAYYNPENYDQCEVKELFIARVKFNSGEGGIELFSNFMPNRTALLHHPEALQAYDKQYRLFLTEIQNESRISSTGLPPDPSLQVILASGLAEAFAQSPERVNNLLTDIDGGWTINYELDDGGLYTVQQLPTQSAKASIDFKLSTLLHSYAITDDYLDVIAHEAAHSFDAQGSTNLDGLPALSAQDNLVFRFIRSELFKQYYASKGIDPNNPNTFGLEEYAFKNTKEFWAEISEFFLSGKKGAQIILNLSPELYGILSRYYNLEYDLL